MTIISFLHVLEHVDIKDSEHTEKLNPDVKSYWLEYWPRSQLL